MRRLLSLALALAVVGCGSDSSSEPTNASVAGTWSLVSVNGAALPFILSASPKIELLSSVVTVASNGTFTSSTQTRTTIGTQATTSTSTQSGTYTLSGSAVAIRSTDGSTVQAGSVSGNTLTLAQTGLVFVYQKQ